MSTQKLRNKLAKLAADRKGIAPFENSVSANVLDIITLLGDEVLAMKEDVYGSWEPLERAAHVPADTLEDFPYKDSEPATPEQMAQAQQYAHDLYHRRGL